jgi:hypothetical protein
MKHGNARRFAPWLRGGDLNRGADLPRQNLAGLGLNLDQGGSIYDELPGYRRFPLDPFVGSLQRVTMLRALIERASLRS